MELGCFNTFAMAVIHVQGLKRPPNVIFSPGKENLADESHAENADFTPRM